MDSAAINSFIPTLDQVDSWSEILTLLPILIILELLLSADNAIALASLTKSLDSPLLRSKALNIGITISLLFRIFLILLSNILLKFIIIRIFAGLYLIYLFISNVFFISESDTQESDNDKKNNNFKFLKIVALLSLTDFAFSIDSITTAVAISDQYILIIFGAIIGVLALRFTSGIFLNLLEKFLRLETAGYIAILIVGIKLLLNTLITETILPDYYFYILILISFIWGFSKRDQIT
jgi:YkoY family integral membrane protein